MTKSLIENKMKEIQQIQQQISMNSAQIESMNVRSKELEDAIKELKDTSEDEIVYRAAGDILIKERNLTKLMGKLEEDKDVINIRLKTLNKQQEALYEKYEALQKEVVAIVNHDSNGKNTKA